MRLFIFRKYVLYDLTNVDCLGYSSHNSAGVCLSVTVIIIQFKRPIEKTLSY